MLRILVVGLIVLVAVMLMLPRPGDVGGTPTVATVLPEARELPAIRFTDHAGNPFSLQQLAGQPTLVFFGFTNCPDVCPLTLAVIAEALASMRARDIEPPQVLFISVDAERDPPERISAYLRGFDAAMIGATADDATLAPLLQAFGVTVHKQVEAGQNYNVVHNPTIFVLDSNARWSALFGGSDHDADTIVSDFVAMRRSL